MAHAVRIAVDTEGGDHAPEAAVRGALAALGDGVEIVLVGAPERVAASIGPATPSGVTVIGPEGPALDTACDLVAGGRADVVLSAGPTGSVVLSAARRLRRTPGVVRPAIAATLPTDPPVVLLDAGAVADPNSDMLVQFALMGSCYARVALGVPRPRVGLLNIGTEPGKGNALARSTFERLQAMPSIAFHGNVEGGDLLHPPVDVIVTDGFTGNVALKLFEAALGIDPGAQRADVDGSAALLGLDHPVLVAHGAARPAAFTAGCRMARELVAGDVLGRFRRELAAA